jgi:hypothetical protein
MGDRILVVVLDWWMGERVTSGMMLEAIGVQSISWRGRGWTNG